MHKGLCTLEEEAERALVPYGRSVGLSVGLALPLSYPSLTSAPGGPLSAVVRFPGRQSDLGCPRHAAEVSSVLAAFSGFTFFAV